MPVTPVTLVQARSMLVVHQLATIQASIKHKGDYIITMLETKIIEAQFVAVSLLRMELVLSEDVHGIIAATERLVRYLKKEAE
jgi:hypothetical protein